MKRFEDAYQTLTVGAIREAIRGVADDVEITFGETLNGVPLHFYRFKWRDEKLLQFELNEADQSLGGESDGRA